jgi:hypothetical protein
MRLLKKRSHLGNLLTSARGLSLSQDEFRCFMLHANPKTRRQNQTAGMSVSIEGYLRKMSNASTDGDHLTLQVRIHTDRVGRGSMP